MAEKLKTFYFQGNTTVYVLAAAEAEARAAVERGEFHLFAHHFRRISRTELFQQGLINEDAEEAD